MLKVVQTLIAHASYFAATVTARAAIPQFASVAAVFGTYDLPVILDRVQRGIRRALALQRYLLARAQGGRNLRFAWKPRTDLLPHHRPPARPAPARVRQARTAQLEPGGPEQLDAWVRRRPVGRTVADICMDLGLVPGFCDGLFWNKVENVLRFYGGSLYRMYLIRWEREKSFQRERDKRPETWEANWRDLRTPTVRAAIGCLFGEPPPAIVPS